jgi:hypothetical protein
MGMMLKGMRELSGVSALSNIPTEANEGVLGVVILEQVFYTADY